MTDTITKFEVGSTYQGLHPDTYDGIFSFTITSRSACYLTGDSSVNYGSKRVEVSVRDGVEHARPFGLYVSAPIIAANFLDGAEAPQQTIKQQTKNILAAHKEWLDTGNDGEGVRLNLRDANLPIANLRGTDLSSADLGRADLTDANLNGAIGLKA